MTAPHPRPSRLADACCALLIAAYPPWIRRRYGAEMRQFVADAFDDARAAAAAAGRPRPGFHFRALAGLAANGVLAWFDTPRFLAERSWRRVDASWSDGSPLAGSRTSLADAAAVARHALRGLLRTPAFTTASVATLALGIGAISVVFSAVSGVLLSALPYPDVDRLVALRELGPGPDRRSSWVAEETFRDWSERARYLRSVAAWRLALITLTGAGTPERLQGYAVTSAFFEVMGIPMTRGRAFTLDEDTPGGTKAVVLSHGLWQRRFGADPGVIGSVVTIDQAPHTVVGVAGRRLEYPERAEFWIPLQLEYRSGRTFRYLAVVARVARGASLETAGADLDRVAQEVAQEHPDTSTGWRTELRPLSAEITGDLRPFLIGAFLAVALLLAVAVANVLNLFVARMTARQDELAVRRALGAGPARLFQMFLVEALLIACGGGAAGVVAASWGARALGAALLEWLPYPDAIALDGTVLAFACLVTAAVAALLGLVPAALSPRASIGDGLRTGVRSVVSHARAHRLRTGLLAIQVALAVVLLVGAVLLARSLHYLHRVDPGFDPRQVLTFDINLPDGVYDADRRAAAIDLLRAGIGALPGVEAVGTVFPMPMVLGSVPFRLATPEMASRRASERPMAHSRLVSPGYVEAMRIPLVRGRSLTDDDRADRAPVAVINQSLARQAFAGVDPIGRRITFQEPADPDAEWATVVGVVGDVRFRRLWNDPEPEVYLPVMQRSFAMARVVVRTEQAPADLARALAAVVRRVDPDLPVADLRTAEAILSEGIRVTVLTTTLLALFSVMAAGLALVGVLGVLSLVVARRLREMGVRMALGARPTRVVGLVVGNGMVPVIVGTAAGLAAASAATRLVASQVHGVSRLDPWSFFAAGAGFLVAAAVTCLWPAVRAARVDPVIVLRSE